MEIRPRRWAAAGAVLALSATGMAGVARAGEAAAPTLRAVVPAASCAPATDAYGEAGDLFALREGTTGQSLLRLSSTGTVETTVAVNGLVGTGERLLGIDVRPANGQIYAIGTSGQLYVVDPATAKAVPVGAAPGSAPAGAQFGLDVNPTIDRIRLVSDTGTNVVVNPDDGTYSANTALAYTAGDPNAGDTPAVGGLAYTNSVPGASRTALYALDGATDALVLLGSRPDAVTPVAPSTGELRTVGALGLDVDAVTGFEIVGPDRVDRFEPRAFTAVAVVRKDAGSSQLVSVDLSTGAATVRATIPGSVGSLAASPGPARTVFATTSTGTLLRFDRDTPGTTGSVVTVTGLAGDTLVGIDVRPANGSLVAYGLAGQLYRINPLTGAAVTVGAATGALTGARAGVDVNPAADALRVVTVAGENLAVNLDTGVRAAGQTPLAYAGADANAAFRPNVVAAAYSNNVALANGGGAAGTTLYDIDGALGVLATQAPPASGQLTTIGEVRPGAVGAQVGFDIGPDGVAVASLQPATSTATAPSTVLACVNLTTGAATEVGAIGSGLAITGLAVAPRGYQVAQVEAQRLTRPRRR